MICIFWRIRRISSLFRARISCPSNRTDPAVGSIRRRMARPVVDLPQPLSPTTPSVFPGRTEKVTLSTAWSIPFGVLKYFFRPSTSKIGLSLSMVTSLLFRSGRSRHSAYRLVESAWARRGCKPLPHIGSEGQRDSPPAGWWDRASGPGWVPAGLSGR